MIFIIFYNLKVGFKMGRIKTKMIKRISKELFEIHKDDFKDNFTENKTIVEGFADIKSKKMRNIIAGYLTRLVKMKDNF